MRVTMLGSGTSGGVPRIGNNWGACDPAEPKNRRRRVSVMVEHEGVRLLVDTGPDFREQMLSANVDRLDAILFTHDHADHTHGIDDVRQIFHATGRPVDCYAHPATWQRLRFRFDYVFEGRGGYPPTCIAHELPERLEFGPLSVTWFPQIHGEIKSAGFRFEAAEADQALQGLDLWIVDALRRHPHPTHSHLERTLGWIDRYRPKRAVLTHMDQSMDYATLLGELPAGVEPGYDMLVMEL
jgi:phosphoribosyl 1,2-cyclic phosphate phosphodiesterase